MGEQIKGLGDGGWIADAPPMILPMNIFSDVSNVRFDDDAISCITGEALGRTVAIAPDYGIHWQRPDQGYNIFVNDGNAVRVDAAGGSSVMLSSVDAKYSNSDWQGTLFNGGFAVIINNGKSTPLYALYGHPSAGTTFQELPGWNYLGGLTVTAKVVRSLNYSLIAANLTLDQSGTITNAPGTIRVSTQAATGGVPQIWAPGTTTDTADEFELSSTSPVRDMAELRGNMFIYSEDSISILTIGQVTRVSPYSRSYGILTSDCVIEFDGNHFVVDRNDIYVHNGSGSIQSVSDKRVNKYFFNNLNRAVVDKVYLVKNPFNKEIWICYPKGVSTVCNEALIYRYGNNTWTKRTLVGNTYAFQGPENVGSTFQYAKTVVYMTTNTTQTLVTDSNYLMWNGAILASINSYLEKKKVNTGNVTGAAYVSALYPVFDQVPVDTSISVRVMGQDNYTTNVDLSVASDRNEFLFLPSAATPQGYKVDPRVKGRVLNYRISGTDYWRLAVMALEVQQADRR